MSRTKLTPTPFNRFRYDYSPMAAKRRYLGLSQGQLARAVGVHQETVGRTERNVTAPTVPYLDAIAGALGVPIWQLFNKIALE